MAVSSPIVVLGDGFLMMCGRWSGMELECSWAVPGETRFMSYLCWYWGLSRALLLGVIGQVASRLKGVRDEVGLMSDVNKKREGT